MANPIHSSPAPAPAKPQQTDQDIEDKEAKEKPKQPGAYEPTDEVPDCPPLKPSKWPMSSAPLPEGVTSENIQKSTPAISSPRWRPRPWRPAAGISVLVSAPAPVIS